MNNSPMKGGTPDTFRIVKSSPGLLDFWQLHYSENVGKGVNSQNAFIANIDSMPTNHPAHYLKLSAALTAALPLRMSEPDSARIPGAEAVDISNPKFRNL